MNVVDSDLLQKRGEVCRSLAVKQSRHGKDRIANLCDLTLELRDDVILVLGMPLEVGRDADSIVQNRGCARQRARSPVAKNLEVGVLLQERAGGLESFRFLKSFGCKSILNALNRLDGRHLGLFVYLGVVAVKIQYLGQPKYRTAI
jgi:hypothetical protein